MVRAFPRSQRGFHPQSPCGVHGLLNATRPRPAARPARSSAHAHAQHAPPPAHEANHVGALSFDRLRRKKKPPGRHHPLRHGPTPPTAHRTGARAAPWRRRPRCHPESGEKKAPEDGVEIPPTPRGCKVGPTAQPCTPQRTTLSVGGPGGRGLFFRRTRNRGFVNLPVAATGCAGEQAPPRVATAGRMSLGGPGGGCSFSQNPEPSIRAPASGSNGRRPRTGSSAGRRSSGPRLFLLPHRPRRWLRSCKISGQALVGSALILGSLFLQTPAAHAVLQTQW